MMQINSLKDIPAQRSAEIIKELQDKVAQLEGKTFDLEAAFRQLCVLRAHAAAAVTAVWSCELGRLVCYRMVALPFGGVGAAAFGGVGAFG